MQGPRRWVVQLAHHHRPEDHDRRQRGSIRAVHLQLRLYRQGAHYLDGFKREHFAFIAVEKDPPYANAVYQLESEVIDKGRAELERLLAIYAECERTGIYPGYESGVRYIGVPVWAATRIG